MLLVGWSVWAFLGRNKQASERLHLHEKIASAHESTSIMSKENSMRISAIEHQTFMTKKISNEDLDFAIRLYSGGTKATSDIGKTVFPADCVSVIQNCQSWQPGQEEKVKQLFELLTQNDGPNATEANHRAATLMVSEPKFPNRHWYLKMLTQSKFEMVSSRAKEFLAHEKP